jgi:thiamine-phosphate pyrophosphorylase
LIRYRITNGLYSRDPEAWLRDIGNDADYIQIRECDLTARDLAALVRKVQSRVRVPILVNDRADVAIACGAAGVHLRSHSVRPMEVKRLAPLLLSVACHEMDDIERNIGADFLIVAPIFHPISKVDTRPPLGLDFLTQFTAESPVPVLALGGITEQNAPLCVAAGAAGIAGIGFWAR